MIKKVEFPGALALGLKIFKGCDNKIRNFVGFLGVKETKNAGEGGGCWMV